MNFTFVRVDLSLAFCLIWGWGGMYSIYALGVSQNFSWTNPFNPHTNLKGGTSIRSIMQMRSLRCRQAMVLAQGHKAGKW